MSIERDLHYDKEQHKTILSAIQERHRLSREYMSRRYTTWTDVENQFLAYLPTSENDAARKVARKAGVPHYTTIELPYSYAIMMTAHTYLTSTLLSRAPVFQFAGRHGEAETKVQALEALIDYQIQVGEMLVPLYVWLFDALKYGLGVVGTYWDEDVQTVSRIVERKKSYLGIELDSTEKVRVVEQVKAYSGNKVFNIRPQDFFPDPRVPIGNLQNGEFCGRIVDVSWNTIIKGEQKGKYFNIAKLRQSKSKQSSISRDLGSPQMELPPTADTLPTVEIGNVSNVSLLEMTIEIIPTEWKLGTTKWPEKWVFTVANNCVIIGAQPLGMYHNKFPYVTYEPEFNGYSLFNRGLLEITKPLNDVMTWLINSHFYNVRKAMNDSFIVDPSRVEIKDFRDPGPGRILRLKPSAYGSDVRTVLTQMAFTDVTKQHLGDISIVADMIQRMTGVNENVMGMVNSGGRKSATEVRSSNALSINRMKTQAEFASAQGFSKLAAILVSQTQQMYSEEQTFRIAGSLIEGSAPFVQIDKEMIAGYYDFINVDGTMPIDKMAMVNTWKELMVQGSALPGVMEQFDFVKMFSFVAQLAGARNINQFKIQVRPDAQMQASAAAGNSIPLGGATAPGSTRGTMEAPQPRQVSGVGPLA